MRGRHSLGEIHGSFAAFLIDFVEEQIVGGFHSAIWKSTFSPSFFGSDNSRLLIIRLLQREFTFASGRRCGHYQSQIIMIQSGNEVLKAGFSPFLGQTTSGSPYSCSVIIHDPNPNHGALSEPSVLDSSSLPTSAQVLPRS